MEKSKELLLSFLDGFNLNKELHNLTTDKVRRRINEEWFELQKDGVSPEEATSIIIDGNYKWMSIKAENKKFVYEMLLILNKVKGNSKILVFLNNEINDIEKQIMDQKKSKQLVR
ncbi:hypothetical protein CON78_26085 [Bacillus toyonensis]|uniref:hypothetical protein n=1 Tax=Bacillus toyonensis TaxID=155322 RepID=UPI000BEBBB07|nr:hypothetical protein [Bacillus toyonensis]MCG3795994.1 hypothetical protein [Bacillus toyonensis]PED97814.1 hypothetical protein CON78_26085 [Bacillus toyonensis]